MNTADRLAIWNRINERCRERGIKVTRLHRITGLNEATVRRWECGVCAPNARAIILICTALHCSADWLLGLRPFKMPPPRYNPPKETQ